jgi:WD40 repeat protein
MTLRGHSEYVSSVAFSQDGKRIASGSADRTIKIWDAEDGRQLMTLKGHSAKVVSVAFSPDGRKIASGGGDGTILIFPAADWKQ